MLLKVVVCLMHLIRQFQSHTVCVNEKWGNYHEQVAGDMVILIIAFCCILETVKRYAVFVHSLFYVFYEVKNID